MTKQEIIAHAQTIYDADNPEGKTVTDVVEEDGYIQLVLNDDSRFIVTGPAARKLDDWLG